MKVRVQDGEIQYQFFGELTWWLCPPDRAERLAATFETAGKPDVAEAFRKAVRQTQPMESAA